MKEKCIYEKPEITFDAFEVGSTLTTSGYEFFEEGYGEELNW